MALNLKKLKKQKKFEKSLIDSNESKLTKFFGSLAHWLTGVGLKLHLIRFLSACAVVLKMVAYCQSLVVPD